MRIAIGSDHRGLVVKQAVIKLINGAGHSYQDFGAHNTDSVDYPDIAGAVAGAVAGGNYERGILICGTGIGMSVAANKVKGIRAALCHNTFSAGRARQHNDANVLCLGAEDLQEPLAEIVSVYLNGEFEGGRHQRRLDKIGEMES